jgi:prepilin-type N-terminal cleavage/methylation domain-containing protein
MSRPRRRSGDVGGFTLLEMLIVVAIVVIVATIAVATLGVFFRGQGARQGAMVVSQVIAQAKQQAAKTRRHAFVVFSPQGKDGWLEIHMDKNGDGIYQGDQDPRTDDPDPLIEDGRADLPRMVVFEYSPAWMSISPSGYLTFSGGFKEIQASSFDAILAGQNPKPVGDIILRVQNQPYVMCMDLDRASGKVRRSEFLNVELD